MYIYIFVSPKHFGSRWHSLHFMLRFKKFMWIQWFAHFLLGVSFSVHLGAGCFHRSHFSNQNNFTVVSFWQSNCIPGRNPHGMLRLHRAPRGTTLAFYGVFVNPLHRHLLLQIWEYLVDSDHQFTVHTLNFALSCPFFQNRILTIRQVDTPSVASEDSDG